MSTEVKLRVPYVSQYRDIEDRDHRLRACGMTSVYMVLRYYGAKVPSLDELVECGVREGGFSRSGWIHDYLVAVFERYGYVCERRENLQDRDAYTLCASIQQGNPVIVSVIRRMWDRRDFHMVLLTGVREADEGRLEGFFYHDPASLRDEGAQHRYVPLSVFYLDWRRTAILPRSV